MLLTKTNVELKRETEKEEDEQGYAWNRLWWQINNLIMDCFLFLRVVAPLLVLFVALLIIDVAIIKRAFIKSEPGKFRYKMLFFTHKILFFIYMLAATIGVTLLFIFIMCLISQARWLKTANILKF